MLPSNIVLSYGTARRSILTKTQRRKATVGSRERSREWKKKGQSEGPDRRCDPPLDLTRSVHVSAGGGPTYGLRTMKKFMWWRLAAICDLARADRGRGESHTQLNGSWLDYSIFRRLRATCRIFIADGSLFIRGIGCAVIKFFLNVHFLSYGIIKLADVVGSPLNATWWYVSEGAIKNNINLSTTSRDDIWYGTVKIKMPMNQSKLPSNISVFPMCRRASQFGLETNYKILNI